MLFTSLHGILSRARKIFHKIVGVPKATSQRWRMSFVSRTGANNQQKCGGPNVIKHFVKIVIHVAQYFVFLTDGNFLEKLKVNRQSYMLGRFCLGFSNTYYQKMCSSDRLFLIVAQQQLSLRFHHIYLKCKCESFLSSLMCKQYEVEVFSFVTLVTLSSHSVFQCEQMSNPFIGS